MISWFKSLIDDAPAGTLLVAASMTLVAVLLFALGEIAGSAGSPDTFQVSRARPDAQAASPFSMSSDSSHRDDPAARLTRVSVMEPVGAIR